jgi:1-acyl-sn-glycerol-3-phosphate acyltransferase
VLSVWVWFAVAAIIVAWTFVVAAVWLPTLLFDRHRRITQAVFHFGARFIAMSHPFWRHTITGALPVGVSTGYIVVCNHESHADSVLISHLPFQAAWLAKDSLLWVPFLGWMMWMSGYVPVHRGARESGKDALRHLKTRLMQGGSVFVFPEGTRSTTGGLGPFKDGAFKLAVETGRPVLPLVLCDCGQALPKGRFVLGLETARPRLHIMEPVPSMGKTVAQLRDEVRAAMEEQHRELKTRASAALA